MKSRYRVTLMNNRPNLGHKKIIITHTVVEKNLVILDGKKRYCVYNQHFRQKTRLTPPVSLCELTQLHLKVSEREAERGSTVSH